MGRTNMMVRYWEGSPAPTIYGNLEHYRNRELSSGTQGMVAGCQSSVDGRVFRPRKSRFISVQVGKRPGRRRSLSELRGSSSTIPEKFCLAFQLLQTELEQ